jgi:hypothetical protein
MTPPPEQHDTLPFDVVGTQRQRHQRTIHPKRRKDLVLAPVAAEIDLNLQRLRDRPAPDVEAGLEIELDRPATGGDRDERAQLVLREAIRNVDMHGWTAEITADSSRLHLEGGSVTLDLGLSAGIREYIEDGVRP